MPLAPVRLYELSTPPQVTTGWTNFDGTPTVYLTSDPGLNQIRLSLANSVGNTVVLPPGTPAEYGALPEGQSAIYIWFEGLLSNGEIEQIVTTPVSGTTWAQAYYADDVSQGLGYLVLAPTEEVKVSDGAGLQWELTNVLAASPFSGQVYVQFMGATGLQPSQTTTQVYVTVQNGPVVGNQALDLVVGFAGTDLVFTGGDANGLTLFLTNPNPTPLVPGGSRAWGPNPPTFQLSLVFGENAGALTTLADAGSITVNVQDEYGNKWGPVNKQTQGSTPTWFMQPLSEGGGQVLGTGQSASIAFGIDGIVTQLPQGLTFAYLSYTNIPGYNDGFYALEILKVDPILVPTFTATPQAITNATGPTTVNFAFTVQNASYVALTNTTYAAPTTSADFSSTAQASVYATTTFTLVASNFATGQQFAVPLQVTVSPDPYHLVPTGTIVMWSGLAATVPNGWAICNGQTVNGITTPDLRDRFIQGADPALDNQTGGVNTGGPADTHTHVIDSASLSGTTGSAGQHYHNTTIDTVSTTLGGSDSIWALQGSGPAGTANTFKSSTVSAHVHSMNLTVPQATSEPQDSGSLMRPAWFALYFIMKCY